MANPNLSNPSQNTSGSSQASQSSTMRNTSDTSGSSMGSSSTMRDTVNSAGEKVRETVKDASDRFTSGSGMRNTDVNQMMDDMADRASQYYNQASSWLQSNSNKVIGALAVVAAIGLFSYFMNRNRSSYGEFRNY